MAQKVKLTNRLDEIKLTKIKLGNGIIQHHKIVLGPYGAVNIEESDLEDIDKLIQSNIDNAGAFNYIRREMAQGKSFEQIIQEGNIALKNQAFVDVSNISQDMTPSEVESRIQGGVEAIMKVAQYLGLTPEQFLKLTPEELKAAIEKVATTQTEVAQEGENK